MEILPIFSTTTHFIQTRQKLFFLSFTNNQEPSHVNAHVAKLVPLFLFFFFFFFFKQLYWAYQINIYTIKQDKSA